MFLEEEEPSFPQSLSEAHTGTALDVLHLSVFSSPNSRANDDVLLFEKTGASYYDSISEGMAIYIDEKSTPVLTQPCSPPCSQPAKAWRDIAPPRRDIPSY